MTIAVGVLVGAVLAAVLWPRTRDLFSAAVFQTTNFRGSTVPNGVGVLVAACALTAEACFAVADTSGHGPGAPGDRLLILMGVVGFALLGLVDDLGAVGNDHGFAGHLRALVSGRLTTGAVKLVGGGVLGVVIAGAIDPGSGLRILVDALLIALCANLGNLLDRGPGRTTKVAALSLLALVATTGAPRALTGVGVVVGAALGLLAFELREELMLGDTGANAVGASLGIGVVLVAGPGPRLVVLVAVAALNLASEQWSFSRVIDRVPPLRFIDRLGRRP